jgi:predicted translin family RNA/ssDNA-binding protein
VSSVDRWRYWLGVCSRPGNLRRTVTIALIVGTILSAINQLDVLVHGEATLATAIKIPLNYLVPFVVSNVGVIMGTRTGR